MNPRKKTAMLAAFDAFSARIAARYNEVRVCLENDQYEEAQAILASLATSHAKTSLSLRGVLIRDGIIKEEL
jgi:hypothetical protein